MSTRKNNRTKVGGSGSVNGKGVVDIAGSEAVEIAANELVEAKAALEAAKKKKTQVAQAIRKHKRTLKDGPSRVEKLKEQIGRAKANTTKSAEELLKKAAEMEKEMTALDKEEAGLKKEASGLYREQEDLRIELGEIREANKAKRTEAANSNGTPQVRSAGMNSSKVALVKALSRRTYVVQYGPGETPVAVGAKSQEGNLELVLGKDDFTMSIQGADSTTHSYGAGAIMVIENAFRAIPKADEKATGTNSR